MKSFYTLIFSIIFCNMAFSQQPNYDDLWFEVEVLELGNLPKSALEKVENIDQLAVKHANEPQHIKALLYKSKFALLLEEEAQLNIIKQFKLEVSKTKAPAKNILESQLANLYWDYFKSHRYQFYRRTKTEIQSNIKDFRTWDLETLFNEIQLHFDKSLGNENILKKTPIDTYKVLLKQHKTSHEFSPTVYDLLVHNALAFYTTNERHITRPAYKFEVDDPKLLSSRSEFVKLNLDTKDSTSLDFKALKLYQNLTEFHLNDASRQALAVVDLERLKFVYQHATFKEAKTQYMSTLQSGSSSFSDSEISGFYTYELAHLYFEDGQTYRWNTDDETHRWKLKTADSLCEQVISSFPESTSAAQCEALKAKITEKEVRITTEKIIPTNTISRFLIAFKNVEHIQFKSYKISNTDFLKYQESHTSREKESILKKLKVHTTWEKDLRQKGDFQTHTSEVIVPAFKNGLYIITASDNTSKTLGFTDIQVTNIALVEKNNNSEKIYQCLNRLNGKPIKQAEILVSYLADEKIIKSETKHTDAHGEFIIKKSESNNYNSFTLAVKSNQETAHFYNQYIGRFYKAYSENQDSSYKSFIFTDRSIYRPGQTVFFKAIAMETKNGQSAVLENETVYATLYNANDEDLSELTLKTNAFGSVSGEFILPTGGLNGQFYIEFDSDSGDKDLESHAYFSVEDYKRPTFEVSLDSITNSYAVNDTVVVKGQAKAFSGSTISNAKVVYRVHRTVKFPRWYLLYHPYFYSEQQEITHGELLTDDSGTFKIPFKALPDLSIDKKNRPIFNYEITADITDINGETRSTTSTIKVGYHTLSARLEIENNIDKQIKSHVVKLHTSNLNGSFVPTTGTLNIYKLQAPRHVLRDRPWQAPDYQDIDEKTFKALFPYDAYANENDSKTWQNGNLVLNETVNTATSKSISLGSIKKWESGLYKIVFEAKDKNNQLIKDESTFTVYSEKDKTLADHKLFQITTNQSEYQPNEQVKITLASAAKHLVVTLQIEKNHKIISKQHVVLEHNKKTISIPVNDADYGGFAVHYSYAFNNTFNQGTSLISVPYPASNLQIETKTFRNKIEPGTDETWRFIITGADGERVNSEILASMYDASLDQFKLHSWTFNPLHKPKYYTYYQWNDNYSFGTSYLSLAFTNPPRTKNQSYFDALNWFGFDFNGNTWDNHRYLLDIQSKHSAAFGEDVPKGHIRGTVLGQDGLALPGVNISKSHTKLSTTTDFDGHFTIKAKATDKIIFSYVGFKNYTLEVGKFNTYTIRLAEDSASLDEVVVTGYGSINNKLSGAVTGVAVAEEAEVALDKNIRIRGANSMSNLQDVLYVIDGVPSQNNTTKPEDIESINVLKGNEATALYGAKGANGVILITTKNGSKFKDVKVRKNLQETAFFFPHLKTNNQGVVSFNFTSPEALTQWKLQLLAHSKTLQSATKTLTSVTQKDLMVQPNAPRFLRQGDDITISSKIVNLSDSNLKGEVVLQLFNAVTNTSIDIKLNNSNAVKSFAVDKNKNTQVSWTLKIPENIDAVLYKIIAKSANFSDGEQQILPVLSNRVLLTESLPMWVNSNETRTFQLNHLSQNTSKTLNHHKLTLEITSNPAWYAIQALPYVMEYPYDCNEQVFSRFYANTLGQHIANSNPRIQEVFKQWATKETLSSALEKNESLKSILIEETPWIRDAKSETEQKKRIGLLFDLNKMNAEREEAKQKLETNQLANGAWPWFAGGTGNRYITQHILIGFGHLQHLGVQEQFALQDSEMVHQALTYLDKAFEKTYTDLEKQNKKNTLQDNHLTAIQLHYLYMRSFYKDIQPSETVAKVIRYYQNQIKSYWTMKSLYEKGLMALISQRNGDTKTASAIIKSLQENSITNDEMGMYWKQNKASWYWYQAPIETQALLIEAFSEIKKDTKTVDNLTKWLLKQKQTNRWPTTKSTTDAVYAILLQGADWLSVSESVDIKVGNEPLPENKLNDTAIEAGTGYFKTTWNAEEITPKLATVTLTKKDKGMAWGSLYWQYFETLDQIKGSDSPLVIDKALFLKTNTDHGKVLKEITTETVLNLGDLITVRLTLKTDRDMEFIHLKDMRASGLEPTTVLSQYKWQDGLGYYESTKDAATHFFIDRLPKGIYVFEYDLRVNNAGHMSSGISTIQSMYAPEFSSHSTSSRLQIK